MNIYVLDMPNYANIYYSTPRRAVQGLAAFLEDKFTSSEAEREEIISQLIEKGFVRLGHITITRKAVID